MPHIDLRPGVTDPVIMMISRRQVESADLASVLEPLRMFTATREDAWQYRGQMSLVVEGYDSDPRELVEIREVRALLSRLVEKWPYWAYFLNQLDQSIQILASCYCGVEFPGGGRAVIDTSRIPDFMRLAFDGMNELFDRHGFPEKELESMSRGFIELLA